MPVSNKRSPPTETCLSRNGSQLFTLHDKNLVLHATVRKSAYPRCIQRQPLFSIEGWQDAE
nr:hypothetical protein [Nostoc sp. EkiNYC01]